MTFPADDSSGKTLPGGQSSGRVATAESGLVSRRANGCGAVQPAKAGGRHPAAPGFAFEV